MIYFQESDAEKSGENEDNESTIQQPNEPDEQTSYPEKSTDDQSINIEVSNPVNNGDDSALGQSLLINDGNDPEGLESVELPNSDNEQQKSNEWTDI